MINYYVWNLWLVVCYPSGRSWSLSLPINLRGSCSLRIPPYCVRLVLVEYVAALVCYPMIMVKLQNPNIFLKGFVIYVCYSFCQWILGFVAFWAQSVSHSQRSELLPWHIFLGLTAYVLALVTAELGLLEKLTFLQKAGATPVGLWSGEAMLVNSIGLAIFVFGASVVLTSIVPNPRREEGYRALA